MSRPPYQIRGGEAYVLHDGEDDTFHFVYQEPADVNGWPYLRWIHDRWTPDAIRNGSMRFYRFVDPPPWYAAHVFATVGDDSTFARFNVMENNELLDSIRNTGARGIPRTSLRPASSPPDDDRAHREQRDGINAAGPGQPPQPPGGGAAAAEGAESRQQQPQREALPALAAALLALPVAEEVPFHQPGTRPLARWLRQPEPPEDASAALRLLANLLRDPDDNRIQEENRNYWPAAGPYGAGGYGVYRPPPIEIPPLNIITNDFLAAWNDIPPQRAAAAPQLPKPQKRVADLVIADAVKNSASCPITMDPIKAESAACVAPCYHVFEKEAIKEWLGGHDSCPECRQACCL
jgi:hypothetical protein